MSASSSDAHIGLREESEAYKLLFGTNEKQAEYWLADSFVRAITGYFAWGLRGICEGEVQKIYYFAYSSDAEEEAGKSAGVRAVVRISSHANIQPNQSGIMEII